MDVHCTSCGAPFDADDRFCGKCGTPREKKSEDSTPATESTPEIGSNAIPGQKRGAIFGVVIMAAVVPLALLALGECGSAEGQMAVTGGPHGEWTFVSTGCASMQPYGMMGANVHGDGHNDGAVYVSMDHASGHKVELEVPGSCQNADGTDCTVFEVPRDACSTFDVTLDYTGTTVNDVRLVEGHAQLECRLEDGTQIRGRVVFDGC